MNTLIDFVRNGGELERQQIEFAVDFLLTDDASVEIRADFLRQLAKKGETPSEIALFVEAFLKVAVDPELNDLRGGPTIDVCGTGGDKLDLFNVSTTSMFVIAAGGANVLKHGNRGITSKSGGADVLEALGVRLDLPKDQLRTCIEKSGVGFIFAQAYHPAFKSIAPVRAQLAKEGQKTLFNLVGPLLNPARPQCQMVGVAEERLLPIFADILQRLGRQSAWIVHGKTADGRGVDELSLMGPSEICKSGLMQSIQDLTIKPEDFGLMTVQPEALRGGDAQANAKILRDILSGKERGPMRDMVILNAAGGLACCGLADHMDDAVEKAKDLINSGEAMKRLDLMIELSR